MLLVDASTKKEKNKLNTDSGTRRGLDVQIQPVRTINYPRKGSRRRGKKKKKTRRGRKTTLVKSRWEGRRWKRG